MKKSGEKTEKAAAKEKKRGGEKKCEKNGKNERGEKKRWLIKKSAGLFVKDRIKTSIKIAPLARG